MKRSLALLLVLIGACSTTSPKRAETPAEERARENLDQRALCTAERPPVHHC